MAIINLEPSAKSLIESVRSIGYSFEAAIADIIDNSVTAKAKEILITNKMDDEGCIHITISDDGQGMTPDELRQAMALGSKNPLDFRESYDYGRFGLGLKTASFSQTKHLMVISRCSSQDPWYGIKWDLNHVVESNRWEAFVVDEPEEELTKFNLTLSGVGTHVLWLDCDRMLQDVELLESKQRDLDRLIEQLEKKLSLIFHKLIDKKRIKILINNNAIAPMDPFCLKTGENHSVKIFDENMELDQSQIRIVGYVLPHISRMGGTANQEKISLDCDHAASQGIYFYRMNRLICAVGWHGLMRKSQANSLARVEVSIENDADLLWQLDIKKSTVIMPSSLRQRMKDLCRQLSNQSTRVFSNRTRLKKTNPNSLWFHEFDKTTRSLSYKVDREHPAMAVLLEKFEEKQFFAEILIKLIEETFPAEMIANDIKTDKLTSQSSLEKIEEKIEALASTMRAGGVSFEIFKTVVLGELNFEIDPKEQERIIAKQMDKFKE